MKCVKVCFLNFILITLSSFFAVETYIFSKNMNVTSVISNINNNEILSVHTFILSVIMLFIALKITLSYLRKRKENAVLEYVEYN